MKNRFTLLELLIVIAIIGILVTLLFPSLSKARKRALSAVCLSNLSQQTNAYTLFAKNNKNRFPQPNREASLYTLEYTEAKQLFNTGLPDRNRDASSSRPRITSIWQCPMTDNARTGRAIDYRAYMYNIDTYVLLANLRKRCRYTNRNFASYYAAGAEKNSPSLLTDDIAPLSADIVLKWSGTSWLSSHGSGNGGIWKSIIKRDSYNIAWSDGSVKTKLIPVTPPRVWGWGSPYYFWHESE